ncbi:MAG: NAD-dependent epimerase/dehydratase family protein [Bdellovibrionota bacterium]
MKIVVTGASGFLGSWLVHRLLKEDADISILARATSDLTELGDVKYRRVLGDVTNPESLKNSFKDADYVFHLAGLIAYRKADRAAMEKVNVEGTKNVIDAVQACGVKRLLHVSSVVAVGAGFKPTQILNENSPFNLSHLNLGYFETKRQAEELVVNAVKNSQIDAVIVNPSTAYGAGDAKKGSRKTQLKVARGKFKVYPSGGVNIVAVEDVVDGMVAALKKGRSGERYILSNENLYLKQVFDIIAEEAGVEPPKIKIPDVVIHSLGQIGDAMGSLGLPSSLSRENAWAATLFHWFDNTKAKNELGLTFLPARTALKRSVQWMKENGLLDEAVK